MKKIKITSIISDKVVLLNILRIQYLSCLPLFSESCHCYQKVLIHRHPISRVRNSEQAAGTAWLRR